MRTERGDHMNNHHSHVQSSDSGRVGHPDIISVFFSADAKSNSLSPSGRSYHVPNTLSSWSCHLDVAAVSVVG